MSENLQSRQATMKVYEGNEQQVMSVSTRKHFEACRASLAGDRRNSFWVFNYVQMKAMELLLALKVFGTANNEPKCGGSSNGSTSKIDAEAGSSAKQEKAEDPKWAPGITNKEQECGGSSNGSTGKVDAESGSSAEQEKAEDPKWVPIGSGKTLVPRDKYKKMEASKTYTIATRRLLMAVFPRSVLATHSMTGKPSPAFPDKPAKLQLDPQKISDVILEVLKKFRKVSESSVRSTITTKCADEFKMLGTRRKKNASTK